MSRAAAIALALLLPAAGCRGRARDPFVTYFNGDHLVSLRYPATWKVEEGAQEGVWYRHIQSPAGSAAGVTVTVLAGPTAATVDQYAQSYLAGNTVASVEDASRQGAGGKRWRYASPDGAKRFGLLLLQDRGQVWGVHSQAPAAGFEEQGPVIEEMEKSLTLEKPREYPQYRQDRQGFAIRVPPSWSRGQNFSAGGTYLMQFISPALAAEKRQTQHASLTVTVEPAPGDGSLDAYYSAVRQRLGEANKVLTELSWRGGRVAMFRMETPLAASRVKRYFWTSGPRAYTVACESREDVFLRVTRWCDAITSTLEIDGRPLPADSPTPLPSPSGTPRPLIAR